MLNAFPTIGLSMGSGKSVVQYVFLLGKMELTAAGTVPDLHRIPFLSTLRKSNIDTKSEAKVDVFFECAKFF